MLSQTSVWVTTNLRPTLQVGNGGQEFPRPRQAKTPKWFVSSDHALRETGLAGLEERFRGNTVILDHIVRDSQVRNGASRIQLTKSQ